MEKESNTLAYMGKCLLWNTNTFFNHFSFKTTRKGLFQKFGWSETIYSNYGLYWFLTIKKERNNQADFITLIFLYPSKGIFQLTSWLTYKLDKLITPVLRAGDTDIHSCFVLLYNVLYSSWIKPIHKLLVLLISKKISTKNIAHFHIAGFWFGIEFPNQSVKPNIVQMGILTSPQHCLLFYYARTLCSVGKTLATCNYKRHGLQQKYIRKLVL